MLFWTIVKVALKSLLANKLRSILAMLGIIIGVAAVISMLAIGNGAKKQILTRINSMGTNLLVVRAGRHEAHGVASGVSQKLTLEDAQALVKEVTGIEMISPVVQSQAQLKYYNKNAQCSIVGGAVTYLPIRNFQVEFGRSFTEGEAENLARVAVIGPVTKENLFGKEDAIGETIKIKGINFTVVGILKAKGDQGWFNPDDQAIMPYTTLMKQISGDTYLREIDLQVVNGTDSTKIQEKVTAVLRRRHRIQPEAENDFEVRNQAEMIQMVSDTTWTFTVLLGSVAAISLLVGGIGIMNIMLVTVTERTREIGVRKAIGAKSRDILSQFLLEAVIMSSVGGALGVGAGVGVARLIGAFSPFTTETTMFSIILSISFAGGVGIFFGYYPARRAAALDPIDALRYE